MTNTRTAADRTSQEEAEFIEAVSHIDPAEFADDDDLDAYLRGLIS